MSVPSPAPSARRSRFIYLADSAVDGGQTRSGAGRFGWRLLAANNRPLGRGTSVHSSLDECRTAARSVQRVLRGGEAPTTVDVTRGKWTWRISIDGTPAAVSVHTYMRRVECTRALSQFAAAALAADPDEGVVRHFGANSLRAYEGTYSSAESTRGTTA